MTNDDIPILPPLSPFDNEDKNVVVVVEFMSEVLADWFYKLDKYDREEIIFTAWYSEQLKNIGDNVENRNKLSEVNKNGRRFGRDM
jgi:hypothetical protein